MEVLGVTEIRHYVAQTNKGDLTLMLRKGESEYNFVLDAVPLDKDMNKELMELLYPISKPDVPQVKKIPMINHPEVEIVKTLADIAITNRKGIQIGSKNINNK